MDNDFNYELCDIARELHIMNKILCKINNIDPDDLYEPDNSITGKLADKILNFFGGE